MVVGSLNAVVVAMVVEGSVKMIVDAAVVVDARVVDVEVELVKLEQNPSSRSKQVRLSSTQQKAPSVF